MLDQLHTRLMHCRPSNALKNVKILNEGVETPVDLSSFCQINDGNGEFTLVVDRKGLAIQEVLMIEKTTGKSKTIVPIENGFFGEYDNADLDPEIYKDALLDPPGWDGGLNERWTRASSQEYDQRSRL